MYSEGAGRNIRGSCNFGLDQLGEDCSSKAPFGVKFSNIFNFSGGKNYRVKTSQTPSLCCALTVGRKFPPPPRTTSMNPFKLSIKYVIIVICSTMLGSMQVYNLCVEGCMLGDCVESTWAIGCHVIVDTLNRGSRITFQRRQETSPGPL